MPSIVYRCCVLLTVYCCLEYAVLVVRPGFLSLPLPRLRPWYPCWAPKPTSPLCRHQESKGGDVANGQYIDGYQSVSDVIGFRHDHVE